MKSYNKLENREKAYFLHRWFPQHMTALTRFILDMAITMEETIGPVLAQELTNRPNSEYLPAIALVKERLAEPNEIAEKATVFSKQLFSRGVNEFTIYCLLQYVTVIRHLDPKFTQAVIFLFEP